jgi:hypothetical protein
MLLKNKISCLTCLILAVLIMTCACARSRIAPELASRTYNKPYDKVWEAVTGVVLDDLGCVERKLKKNKGYLETEWVHSMDTEGHHRWKIEAYLKKHEGAVLVQLDKIVQMKDDVSRTINKYSKTAEKSKEPVGPNAGWSNETATARDIEDLYRKIDLRLGE